MDVMQRQQLKLALNAESLSAYEDWAARARPKIAELLGLDNMTPCDMDVELLETRQMDGYRREKRLMQVEPGVYMPFYVLIPDGIAPGERVSAVLAPHGHVSAGKEAVVGNGAYPELARAIAQHNYDYGVQAVKLGFIALCPDARGFGERREKYWQGDEPDKRMSSSCVFLNSMAMPLGRNVAGMWTWDLMRLMDYAQSRADIDPERIGCIGLSGGGLQTLWFSALDRRVKCAVISGYFYGFREALQEEMCCNCNYIPHMWEYVDVGEVGALIAPRPLLIETGTQDTLNGRSMLDNVRPYVAQARTAYALYGKADDLYHDVFEGPHMWHGVYALPFIQKHLQAKG